MPRRSVIQRLLIPVLLLIGLFPVFLLSVPKLGIAETSFGEDSSGTSSANGAERYVENLAFGVGEKLTFDIRYGFISAGSATMEVVRLIEYQERPCYQIVTRAISNSFFSSFYRVEDRVESILDATGLFSWRFEKSLREGNYRSDRMYSFDHELRQVVYKTDTLPIEPFIQDALSTLYYVRTQPLKVGESVWIDNFVDGKSYKLEVRVTDREEITVSAGTFNCLVVEPITQSVGIFKHEGKLTVWLTDDALRMPVQMKSKIVVGSVTAELTDFELGRLEEF